MHEMSIAEGILMTLEEQAQIIARAHGPAGPNREYLHNTAAHLRQVGIHDPEMERLDALVSASPA